MSDQAAILANDAFLFPTNITTFRRRARHSSVVINERVAITFSSLQLLI